MMNTPNDRKVQNSKQGANCLFRSRQTQTDFIRIVVTTLRIVR